MSVNRSENIKDNELPANTHPITFRLVATFAIVLIALPLLPALIANLAYSFSGHAPKIYWYLSRAGGFIALSILWVSMAMGLGLTNKLARWWPGAPAAFAVHEYVSLLGLLFAVYHGLVLIGDHYVDFSLPRLVVPFSIQYEPFWVGLGQVAFYTWVIVLLSFYVRQYIGQKTWRMIHYANFATYVMGMLHGLFSGTDGTAAWAHWYYGVSSVSLLALLAYRIYITVHKKKASQPKPSVVGQGERLVQTPAAAEVPISAAVEAAPQISSLEQASASSESPPTDESAPASIQPVIEDISQPASIEKEQVPALEQASEETQLPINEKLPISIKIFDEIPIPPADPVLRIKMKPSQNQTQTPPYEEPATLPSQRKDGVGPIEKVQLPPILMRIKENQRSESAKHSLVIRSKRRQGIPEN